MTVSAAPAQAEEQSDSWLLSYHDEAIIGFLEDEKIAVANHYERIDTLHVYADEDSIQTFFHHPMVDYIEQDVAFQLDSSFTEMASSVFDDYDYIDDPLWNMVQMNREDAVSRDLTGQGVKVGIIDTGISPHPDIHLSGGISTVEYTADYYDDNGHGTHVAGVIAGRDNQAGVVGLSPGVSIYSIKALDQMGNGHVSSLIAGIEWAMDQELDVLNLSLSATQDIRSLERILQDAYNDGMLIFAAAGNSGTTDPSLDTMTYPAKYDDVIAVGASNPSMERSIFSSTGDQVEFSAPGEQIISTYLDNRYAVMKGTSAATPHVAALSALLFEEFPGLTHHQIRNRLQSYVIPTSINRSTREYGFGISQYIDFKQEPATFDRLFGQNALETSAAIAREGWSQSDTVVLARHNEFADALAGVPLAAHENGPLILTRPDRLNDVTRDVLRDLRPKKVIILGGAEAVSLDVELAIRQMEIDVERVGGQNRYETATLIATKLFTNSSPSEAFIVTDRVFADSISIAPEAGKNGIPILLTQPERLSSATEAFIDSSDIDDITIIGGDIAVSSAVEGELQDYNVNRISGANRYETNKLINETYFKQHDHQLFVARGDRFEDGLSGAALAAANESPLVLVSQNLTSPTRAFIASRSFQRYMILGGDVAIEPKTVEEINKLKNR
ncbi:conserved hypothetical protein with cell wall binding domains [Salisediminibacterium beveridgei]|uniref:Peptidase S8/S53 domain-containing protein n=1 Tax=Salisediminibacterium beveridgei TaxID=632773 RepID=A0A1D7QRQ1_9BACI|nr:conserved hypothetical protein with cell wall binding domains [Salisediminibacterium beveridgei]